MVDVRPPNLYSSPVRHIIECLSGIYGTCRETVFPTFWRKDLSVETAYHIRIACTIHHPPNIIRIAVNGELDALPPMLEAAADTLAPGGRLAVITFHSLEDRIVKQHFSALRQGCTCPRDFPVCVCGKKPKVKLISRKPIVASDEELEINPRSRSAKLRVCEKI